MEARQTDNKYGRYRRGISAKLADIQHEIEQLSERVQAVLQARADQEGGRDDRRSS